MTTTSSRRRTQVPPLGGATTTGTKRKRPPLPAWAQARPCVRQQQGTNTTMPLTARDEEAYLRTQSYHQVARHLDEALQAALEQAAAATTTVKTALDRLVQDNKQNEEDNNNYNNNNNNNDVMEEATTRKEVVVRRTEEDGIAASEQEIAKRTVTMAAAGVAAENVEQQPVDEDASSTTMRVIASSSAATFGLDRASGSADPALLPVLLLQGPVSVLDATLWRQWMAQYVRTIGTSGAVQKTTTTTTTRVVDLVVPTDASSLGRACLDALLVPHNNNNKTGKKNASSSCSSFRGAWTRGVLQWASTTTDHDSLVILLQVQTQAHADGALPSFVRALSDLRAHEGLPVSLVLVGASSLLDWTRALADTSSCAATKHVLPTSTQVLAQLSTQLLLQPSTTTTTTRGKASSLYPPVLSSVVTRLLQHQFVQVHGSAVQVVQQIKQVYAHYFATHQGAFWWCHDKNDPIQRQRQDDDDDTKTMERRLADWFLLDPAGRRLVVVTDEAQTHQGAMSSPPPSFQDARTWQRQAQQQATKARLATLCLQTLVPCNDSKNQVPVLLRDGLAHEPRALSTQERRAMLGHVSSLLFASLRNNHQKDKTTPNDQHDEALELFLCECIVVVDHCALVSQATLFFQSILNGDDDEDDDTEKENALTCLSLYARRRLVTDGLLAVDEKDDNKSAVAKAAGTLYRLMRDVTMISQDDWFQALGASPHVFGCGVLALKVAGLIQEKKSGRGPMQYEKMALVGTS